MSPLLLYSFLDSFKPEQSISMPRTPDTASSACAIAAKKKVPFDRAIHTHPVTNRVLPGLLDTVEFPYYELGLSKQTPVDPGYGFRLLKSGTSSLGAQRFVEGKWVDTPEQKVFYGTFRMRIDPGEGYFIVGLHAAPKEGDEVLASNSSSWLQSHWHLYNPDVETYQDAANKGKDLGWEIYAVRRKLPSFTASDNPLKLSPVTFLEARMKEAELRNEIKLLQEDLQNSKERHHKATLKVTELVDKVKQLEIALEAEKGLKALAQAGLKERERLLELKSKDASELRDRLAVMQKNATGNAVLVRKDGFSSPVTFPPEFMKAGLCTYIARSGGAYKEPFAACYQPTTKVDGFGRAIYEQV